MALFRIARPSAVRGEVAAERFGDDVAGQQRAFRNAVEHGGDDLFGVVEILLELERVVDAVVALREEFLVVHRRAVLVVRHARGFDEAVGHQRAGRDDRLHPAAVDHLADHETLLCDRHRSRDGEHAKAVAVAHHGFEHVGGFAEVATAERRRGHAAHQRVHRSGRRDVERAQRFEPVVGAAVQVAKLGVRRHASPLESQSKHDARSGAASLRRAPSRIPRSRVASRRRAARFMSCSRVASHRRAASLMS